MLAEKFMLVLEAQLRAQEFSMYREELRVESAESP